MQVKYLRLLVANNFDKVFEYEPVPVVVPPPAVEDDDIPFDGYPIPERKVYRPQITGIDREGFRQTIKSVEEPLVFAGVVALVLGITILLAPKKIAGGGLAVAFAFVFAIFNKLKSIVT